EHAHVISTRNRNGRAASARVVNLGIITCSAQLFGIGRVPHVAESMPGAKSLRDNMIGFASGLQNARGIADHTAGVG
ncbi:MAG: hypothetical protein ACREIV_06300, partial [Planctomycetaceae bacterium]